MAEVRLAAERRGGTGKGVARRARAVGKVPAIVYGGGMEPIAVQVDRRELVTALHTDAGLNVLLDIEIDGETTLALTRELQRDPVKGTVLHADFVKVDRTRNIEVDVPLQLQGEPEGVRAGGVLEHPLFTLRIRCLPTDVPEHVDVDVSDLGMGESIKVADLPAGRAYEILDDPEAVVATIAAPVSEEELEAMEAAVAAPGAEEAEIVEQPTAAVPEEGGEQEPEEAS